MKPDPLVVDFAESAQDDVLKGAELKAPGRLAAGKLLEHWHWLSMDCLRHGALMPNALMPLEGSSLQTGTCCSPSQEERVPESVQEMVIKH